MADRTPDQPVDRRAIVAGGLVLVVFAVLAGSLLVLALGSRDRVAPIGAAVDPATFALATREAAPALELTDQQGNPFALTSLAGHPVLVFFGYTHCPDVCPATVGILNQVLADTGGAARAVFVSI